MNMKTLKVLLLSSSLFGLCSKQVVYSANLNQSSNIVIQNLFASLGSKNAASRSVRPTSTSRPSGFQNLFASLGTKNTASSSVRLVSTGRSSGFQNLFASLGSKNTASSSARPASTGRPSGVQNLFASLGSKNTASSSARPASTGRPSGVQNLFASLGSKNTAPSSARPASTGRPSGVQNLFASLGSKNTASSSVRPASTGRPSGVQNLFASLGSHNAVSTSVRPTSTSRSSGVQNLFASLGSHNAVSSPVRPTSTSRSSEFQNLFTSSLSPYSSISYPASSMNGFQPLDIQNFYRPYEFRPSNYSYPLSFDDNAAQRRIDQAAADQAAAQLRADRQRAARQADSRNLSRELQENAARQRADYERQQAIERERQRALEQEQAQQIRNTENQEEAQYRENCLIIEQRAARQREENARTEAEQTRLQRIEALRLALVQVPDQPRADNAVRRTDQENAQRIEKIRVAFEEALPANWDNMSSAQKIVSMIDEIFQNRIFRTMQQLPADAAQQASLKSKLRELMVEDYINIDTIELPLAKPQLGMQANTQQPYFKITPLLATVKNIKKYEAAPFNMLQAEAKEFNTFVVECKKSERFTLAFDQHLSLYRSLKQNFNTTPWTNVVEVLKSILSNSYPTDYKEWPDFDENPDANFDNFIQNIMAPCINGVRGRANTEDVTKAYVENLLTAKQRLFKANIDQKIAVYQDLNNEYTLHQKRLHGNENPLPHLNNDDEYTTFTTLTENINNTLLDLEDQTSHEPLLNQRINYSNLCADPFLYLLRKPDDKLNSLIQNYGNHLTEIQSLTNRIISLIPVNERGLDNEFNESFGTGGFGLGNENDLNKATMIRVKRLYECVKENKDELTAAKVVYFFGAGNSDRCVDGKRDQITELEKEHVYVANSLTANNDFDAAIGLNLSKLFMDDRMNTLRETINALYNAGEPRTYAWFRSHRAMFLGFGLSGKYEEMRFGGWHSEGVDPIGFVQRYFRGGAIRGNQSTRTHNLRPFTVDKMAEIVLQDIRKEMGGHFNNETLDYLVNSDLKLRRAYLELRDNVGDETFENTYFKNANLSQRAALKKEAVTDLLHRYNYIYRKNTDNDRWE